MAGPRRASVGIVGFLVVFPVVIIVVVIIIVIIPVVVVVEVFFLFFVFFFFLFIAGGGCPAFRLGNAFGVQFVPRVQVPLLDVTIEMFDLHELCVLIDGQHTEGFVFLQVFVPLAFDGFVISAHGRS